MATVDKAALDEAVAEAESFGFGAPNAQPPVAGVKLVADAKALSIRAKACEAALLSSIATIQMGDLDAAVAEAESFGFGAPDSQPPVCGVELVMDAKALSVRAKRCEKALLKSIASIEKDDLDAAVAEAESFGFGAPDSQPPVAGVKLVAEAKALSIRAKVCEAALFAAIATIEKAELDAAILEAESFGFGKGGMYPPVAGVQLVSEAKALSARAKACEAALLAAIATIDKDDLDDAVADAGSFGFGKKGCVPAVAGEQLVADAAALSARAKACERDLVAAAAALDGPLLAAALSVAASFGFGKDGQDPPVAGVALVAKAAGLAAKVEQCEAGLAAATATMAEGQLTAAIAAADAFGCGKRSSVVLPAFCCLLVGCAASSPCCCGFLDSYASCRSTLGTARRAIPLPWRASQ